MLEVRLYAVILLTLAGLSVSNAAHATSLTTVVRGQGAGADKAAAFISHFARDIFVREGKYDVVELSDILQAPGEETSIKALQNAEDAMTLAKVSYESLELDEAADSLSRALAIYERYVFELRDLRKLADVLMLLGATHILRGEEKLGNKRLEQAVSIYPRIEADPRVFNPGMRKLFQQAAERVRNKPRGTLTITSTPSYSRVYLDGNFAGVTPLILNTVGEGRHYLGVVANGFRGYSKTLDVVGQVESTEIAALKPSARAEAFESALSTAIKHMSSKATGTVGGSEGASPLGQLAGTSQLFLADVKLKGEQVLVNAALYDVTTATQLHYETYAFGFDSRSEVYNREVTQLLSRFLPFSTGVANLKNKAAPVSGDKKDKDLAVAKCVGAGCGAAKPTWSLWAGLGGGGLLMGTGGLMWYLGKKENNDFRSTAQVSSRSDTLTSSGKTKALVGDLAFSVGAAAAVAGVFWYIFSDAAPAPKSASIPQPPSWQLGAAPTAGGGWLYSQWSF